MKKHNSRRSLVRFALIVMYGLVLISQLSAQSDVRSAAKGNPHGTPTPTPLPPTDTKCYSGPGCLDTALDLDGILSTDVPAGNYGNLDDVFVQPDGKTVTIGSARITDGIRGLLVIRFNVDGSLDTSFGDPDTGFPLMKLGYTIIGMTDGDDTGSSCLLLPDNKILIGGWRGNSGVGPANQLVARLNPDGSLDSSFGVGGKVIYASPALGVLSLAVQLDGKILLSGGGFAAMRLNGNGSVDTSFGNNGTATANPSTRSNGSGSDFSIALQRIPAGSGSEYIVLGGSYKDSPRGTSHYAVLRFTPDGNLDTTFGSGGRVTSSDLVGGAYVAVDGQNRIVAGGNSGFVRYLENGGIDNSFSTHAINIYGGHDYMEDIAIQSDGTILGCLTTENAAGSFRAFAVIRVNADGSPDVTFGPGFLGAGIVTTSILNDSSQFPRAMAVGPDNKITVTGLAGSPPLKVLVRYLP